jgi:hypothetical protein
LMISSVADRQAGALPRMNFPGPIRRRSAKGVEGHRGIFMIQQYQRRERF